MSEPLELPNGVTINRPEQNHAVVELPYELDGEWKCTNCEVHFQSFLIGENGRYQGQIKTTKNDSVVWQGPLPKDRVKADKFLLDSLQKRVDLHKKRH